MLGAVPRNPGTFRKQLTIAGLVFVAALVLGTQLLGLIRDRGWMTVGTIQALRGRGIFYLEEERIFVVDDRGEPLALSALSPHLGEQLKYCTSAGWFVDVHGDGFDRLGFYRVGPSPRGMDRVEVRVSGDLVQVKPGEVTEGPPRGAREDGEPTGPVCRSENWVEDPPGFVANP